MRIWEINLYLLIIASVVIWKHHIEADPSRTIAVTNVHSTFVRTSTVRVWDTPTNLHLHIASSTNTTK